MTCASPPRPALDAVLTQTPAESGVPATLLGWKRRIAEFCAAHAIEKSESATRRLAARIAARAERMQYVDPDALIRSALCYADPTGETATTNVMRQR